MFCMKAHQLSIVLPSKSRLVQLRMYTSYTKRPSFKTNDGLPEISKMKYRNRIQEPGTTISGFADSKRKHVLHEGTSAFYSFTI
jgi:hypothetical protein